MSQPQEINLEYEALMLAEDVQPLIKALYAYYHGNPKDGLGKYDLSAYGKHDGPRHSKYVKERYDIENITKFEIYVRARLWNIGR